MPFEVFGAPWCGPELTAALRERALPGVCFREANYRPTHSSFAGERVQGAQVHLMEGPHAAAADAGAFDPLRVGHMILSVVAELYPDQPLWRESAPDRPEFIDLLWGSDVLRTGIADRASYEEICAASPAPIGLQR